MKTFFLFDFLILAVLNKLLINLFDASNIN